MHRHFMHDDHYVTPCVAFALGVMVGIVGSAKIRFLHKMHMQLHKNYGHSFYSANQQSNKKEDTGSIQTNSND